MFDQQQRLQAARTSTVGDDNGEISITTGHPPWADSGYASSSHLQDRLYDIPLLLEPSSELQQHAPRHEDFFEHIWGATTEDETPWSNSGSGPYSNVSSAITEGSWSHLSEARTSSDIVSDPYSWPQFTHDSARDFLLAPTQLPYIHSTAHLPDGSFSTWQPIFPELNDSLLVDLQSIDAYSPCSVSPYTTAATVPPQSFPDTWSHDQTLQRSQRLPRVVHPSIRYPRRHSLSTDGKGSQPSAHSISSTSTIISSTSTNTSSTSTNTQSTSAHRTCPICGSSQKRKYELKRHLRDIHAKQKAAHTCGYCGATFSESEEWVSHVVEAACSDPSSWNIGVEGSSEFNENPPRLPKVENGYKCDVCRTSYDTRFELNHHMRSHDERGDRKLGCAHCSQRFHFPKDLTRHQRTHGHDERHLFCNVAGCKYQHVGFGRKDHLRRHMSRAHSPSVSIGPSSSSKQSDRGEFG